MLKSKILLPLGILVVLIAIISISSRSSTKQTAKVMDKNTEVQTSTAPAPKPTGDVSDLFAAIDASASAENAQATSGSDETPADSSSDFDQTINSNEL